MSDSEDYIGTTDEVFSICYTWTIKDFSLLMKLNGQKNIVSPMFPKWTNGIKFNLELRNVEGSYCKYLGIRLRPICLMKPSFVCKVIFSIDNNVSYQASKIFDINQSPSCDLVSYHNLFNKSTLLMLNDELIICCEILFTKDLADKCAIVKVPECKLAEDLETLFNTKEFYDVSIVTADGQIPAHKNILSARSKVFAAMFQHPLEETKLGCVILNDFNHDVVNEMLGFMYTGKAPNLESMTEDLLAAAEKYDLERLKGMCAKALCDNLSIERAAITLKIADHYNVKDLLLMAVNFIKSHAQRVVATPSWRNLITTNRYEILESFVEKEFLELKLSDDVKHDSCA